MTCEKRSFPSKHAARAAVKTMGNTVRVYLCENCHQYHNTKERGDWGSGKVQRFKREKRQPRRLRET